MQDANNLKKASVKDNVYSWEKGGLSSFSPSVPLLKRQ